MMNKLKYGYKSVLKPLQNGLKTMSGENRITALADLDERIGKNADRKRVIAELVGKGFLDTALFTKELSDIAAEAEMLKQEKKRLESSTTGNHQQLSELDSLIHYLSKKPEIIEFEDDIFERFVENIVVYSRDEIGFCMKCGITLRERMVN